MDTEYPAAPAHDKSRSRQEAVAVLLAADDLSLDFLQILDSASHTAGRETLFDQAQRVYGQKASLLIEVFRLLTTWESVLPYPAQKRAEAIAKLPATGSAASDGWHR